MVTNEKISGFRGVMTILADIQSEDGRKPTKKGYNTCNVRFYGHSLEKVYTYRVRKGAALHLGQEVVVPTNVGKRIAVVVELHKKPQDNGPFNYLFIEQKVAKL